MDPEERALLAQSGAHAVVERLVAAQPQAFWSERAMLVQLGDKLALVRDGKVVHVLATAHSSLFPRVSALRPLAAQPNSGAWEPPGCCCPLVGGNPRLGAWTARGFWRLHMALLPNSKLSSLELSIALTQTCLPPPSLSLLQRAAWRCLSGATTLMARMMSCWPAPRVSSSMPGWVEGAASSCS